MTRDTHLMSDPETLESVGDFRLWREGNPVNADSLDNMMSIVANAISSDTPLWKVVRGRTVDNLAKAQAAAAEVSTDLHLAVSYVREAVESRPSELDGDPAFLYACDFCSGIHRCYADHPRRSDVLSWWNAAILDAHESRLTSYYRQLTGEPQHPGTRHSLEPPLALSISLNSFPLPFYIDSMQMGQQAWGEGRRIAMRIWDTVSSPASRGQSASLVPVDIPERLEQAAHLWHQEPQYRDWLTDEIGDSPSLPDHIRALMLRRHGGLS